MASSAWRESNSRAKKLKHFQGDRSLSGAVAKRWPRRAFARLLLTARSDWSDPSVEKIEARIEWMWRGENRALRKTMERVRRTRCGRGRGSKERESARDRKRPHIALPPPGKRA